MALAAALDTVLRPKAMSLLKWLQSAHRDAAKSTALKTDVYDGHQFVVHMRSESSSSSAHSAKARSYQWHE